MNSDKISYLLRFPPRVMLKKVLSNLTRNSERARQRSWCLKEQRTPDHDLAFKPCALSLHDMHPPSEEVMSLLFERYRAHRFDHLGCGWAPTSYGAEPPGFLGTKYTGHDSLIPDSEGSWLKEVLLAGHIPYAKKLWSMIRGLNADYTPIDWQRDHRSGFRWDAAVPFMDHDNLISTPYGVDVKVPLELSRLQHLPRMATWLFTDVSYKEAISDEIKCQILDFMMVNPPGMGINYTITMDVGLRISNLLLCCDILVSAGYLTADDPLTRLIVDFTVAETHFVLKNLEYREGYHSNHYLGNVLGVLSAATHLSGTQEAMGWLNFAIQEIESCMERQFLGDGCNFEGSTAYHKLCTEMMIYATALAHSRSEWVAMAADAHDISDWSYIVKLRPPERRATRPFSDAFYQRLASAGEALKWFTKPDGRIIQFGDNDSARCFPLSASGDLITAVEASRRYVHLTKVSSDEAYWDEDMLDASSVTDAFDALFSHDLSASPEALVIRSLMGTEVLHSSGMPKSGHKAGQSLPALDRIMEHVIPGPFDFDLRESLEPTYLPDFGMVIFRSARVYLAMSVITGDQLHVSWGHQHNDKLSIVLWIDGKDLIVDPGSFCYTADPTLRNHFRSSKSHSVIQVNGLEQNDPLSGSFGLFAMKREASAQLLHLAKYSCSASLKYKDVFTTREITIESDRVVIRDSCNHEFEQNFNQGAPLSAGYGKLLAR